MACTNCKGKHFAYSRECPRWKVEKEVQHVKVEKHLSFTEARKVVEASTPPAAGKSYAAAVKVSTTSVAVQTDLTWPNGEDKFKKISVIEKVTKQNTKAAIKQVSTSSQVSLDSRNPPRGSSSGEPGPSKPPSRKDTKKQIKDSSSGRLKKAEKKHSFSVCCMVLLALMVVANTSNGTTNLAWGKPKKYSHSAFSFGNRGGIPRIDGYSRGSNVVYNRHGVPSNRSPVGYGGKRGGYNYKRSPYLRSGKNSPYGVNKGFSNHGSSSGYNNIGGGRSVYPTHGTANGYSTHIRGRGYPTHGQNDVYSSQDENVGYPSHGGRNVYSTYGRANEYSTHVRGSGYPTRGGNSATPRYGGNVGYLNYDGGSGYDNYGGDNGYNKNGGYFKNGYGSGGYRICPNQTFYDDIYRWSDLADGYPRVQINQEIQGGIASANPCANIFNLANCLSRMRPDPTAPTVPTVDPM
ncbi:uncharacterized protein LOC121374613 [Gigantopelta aegis]|uniref:uncharacterized protein LOC121374613 n=1 Tax=Gigantopelta aegis TaxID=1735272 RepID=UPI001B8874A7|nr:uncharacterized protein LOC121374613 [Gigantopelta aegis]